MSNADLSDLTLSLHSNLFTCKAGATKIHCNYTICPFQCTSNLNPENKNVKHNQRSTNNMPKIAIHVGMLNVALLDLVFSVFLKSFFVPACVSLPPSHFFTSLWPPFPLFSIPSLPLAAIMFLFLALSLYNPPLQSTFSPCLSFC